VYNQFNEVVTNEADKEMIWRLIYSMFEVPLITDCRIQDCNSNEFKIFGAIPTGGVVEIDWLRRIQNRHCGIITTSNIWINMETPSVVVVVKKTNAPPGAVVLTKSKDTSAKRQKT